MKNNSPHTTAPSIQPELQPLTPATSAHSQIDTTPHGLYDIYGPIEHQEASSLLPLFIGGTLLFCILAGVVFFFVQRKKRIKNIPYWEEALNKIEENQPLQEKNSIEYIDTLSDIVRHYIEKRFGLHSTRQTTLELLHSSKWKKIVEQEVVEHDLHHCLKQADMAKFAGMQPTTEQLIQMEKDVRHFILQTAPQSEHSNNKQQRGTA